MKTNNRNNRSKAWSMRIKKVGAVSPPKVTFCGDKRRSYGGLKKFGVLTIKNINGIAVRLTSLGSLGLGLWPSSWANPPVAPPRLGTLQEALEYWKGQKKTITPLLVGGHHGS